MAKYIRTIIAARELRSEPLANKRLTVILGKPRRSGKDWVCQFQIKGLEDSEIRNAFGVDAIQALLGAFEGIRVALERSGEQHSWKGGKPGDPGFPRFVPTFYGLEFARKVSKTIDSHVVRFARAAEARHWSRSGNKG